MHKCVIIVNGKPRAGKDTFAALLDKYIPVYKYSSIDYIKAVAMECGWKGGKSEKDRKFLADLKFLTSEYSDLAFNKVSEKVDAFYADEIKEDLMLIDIREPEEIERSKWIYDALTVYINNDNVPEIDSNEADANVDDYDYDYYIDNSGTLDEFEMNVINFIYELFEMLDGMEGGK